MGQWFGTDGIRDLAGEGRLAPQAVARIARALARFAASADKGAARIALGRDSRSSGRDLVAALACAMRAEGAQVAYGGLIATPVLAWWVATGGFSLGVSVSASHNAEPYNGLKPFAAGGRKLQTAEEARIEQMLEALLPEVGVGELPAEEPVAQRYIEALTAALGGPSVLKGQRLLLDLAAGAATPTAGPLLRALGADVVELHPAGERPINAGCGSEYPGPWLEAVRDQRRTGLAFDGDADRVLLADEQGIQLDGDDLLALLALDRQRHGALPGACVVSTVMSNLGLEQWLAQKGVELVRTPVGDRHVAAAMRLRGAVLGAEPSGHVVLPHPGAPNALIGDALVAGILALSACQRLGLSLGEVPGLWERYPQQLLNLRLPGRRDLLAWPELQQAMARSERELAGKGRLLVRWSGTEPVLRIMVEARNSNLVQTLTQSLGQVAQQTY